jgi:hypothetical protein
VVNTDALNAVQQEVVLSFEPGVPSSQASITIPAGKIFVLETVSFSLPGGANFIGISVTGPTITGGQGVVPYELAIPPNGFNGSQALRLYAQPGTIVSILVGVPLPLPPLKRARCPFLVILSTRSSPVHNVQSFPRGSMLGVYGIGWSEKRIREATYTDDPFLVGGFNRLEMLLSTLRPQSKCPITVQMQ